MLQDHPMISYQAVLIRDEVVIDQFIPIVEPKRIVRIERFILLRCIAFTGQLTLHHTYCSVLKMFGNCFSYVFEC
jgi:hypothetical protein